MAKTLSGSLQPLAARSRRPGAIGQRRGGGHGEHPCPGRAVICPMRCACSRASLFAPDSEAALHTRMLCVKELVAIAGVIPQATPVPPPRIDGVPSMRVRTS